MTPRFNVGNPGRPLQEKIHLLSMANGTVDSEALCRVDSFRLPINENLFDGTRIVAKLWPFNFFASNTIGNYPNTIRRFADLNFDSHIFAVYGCDGFAVLVKADEFPEVSELEGKILTGVDFYPNRWQGKFGTFNGQFAVFE